jgi:LDH2 family malate/lactate/ureidoglycolate dehydrogenase
VRYLKSYLPMMRGGAIRPGASPTIVREGPASAVVDGDAGMGHVVAHRAAELAIRKVRENGVGMATILVRNSNHFGAADPLALMCAEAGLIGLVLSNSVPFMAAPGSRRPVIGNCACSYGIPARDGDHMVLDIALSQVAGSRVVMAAERGESIPEGWIVDGEGMPTVDASQMGALVPVGGHKGYGLALLVETLAGVLSGAGVTHDVLNYTARPDDPSQTGHAIVTIDPEAFMSRAEFDDRLERLRDEIHAYPKAPDADRIWLPGEMELEHEAKARAEGLEFDAVMWGGLVDMANGLGALDGLEQTRL